MNSKHISEEYKGVAFDSYSADLSEVAKKGFENIEGEWFKCSLNDIKSAILQIKTGNENIQNRTQNFGLRPEQKEAIEKTSQYFKNYILENPKLSRGFTFNKVRP
jgi:hypothetical protein